MTYQSKPNETLLALLASLGGHVWTTATNEVAGGTGVARTGAVEHFHS